MIEVTAIISKSSRRIEVTFGEHPNEPGATQSLTINEAAQLRDELSELLDQLG